LNVSVIDDHVAAGGRAVVLRDDNVVLLHGEQTHALTTKVVAPAGATLAAVAAAWALGLAPDLINTGIGSFESAPVSADDLGGLRKRVRP
jgi:cyanophycin synthetase